MRLFRIISIIIIILLTFTLNMKAQETIIQGKVTDAETGEPLAFVNVFLKDTQAGATTDSDGKYFIRTRAESDSIIASSIGYIRQSRKITNFITQTVNFELQSSTLNLNEVLFVAEENPAWNIMRNLVENKKDNDRTALDNYEHDTYTKIEFSVAQMAEKFQQKKLVQRIYETLDTLGDYRDEKGEPSIPIFHSESISRMYIQNNPYLQKEEIKKANINGVGIKDKKQVSQLTGVSFQQYNFYDNWMTIIDKEFVSPLANGWKTYYEYYLTDSAVVNGHYSYKLEFEPKNELDLAFRGYMWISKEDYALVKIDAEIGSKANLNFIEKLELYQELEKTDLGPWLPSKTRFLVKVSELAPNLTGVTAKFLISASNFVLNQDYGESFYILPIEVLEDVVEENPRFWDANRPEPLDQDDIKALQGINTVKKIGPVNVIAEIVKVIRRGYYRTKYIDIGPWLYTYAHNDVEGNRIRLSLRTNHYLHEKWVLSGFGVFGTEDERFKYGARVDHIFTKKPWTAVTFEYRKDIEQLGALDETLRKNFIFNAASRFGELFKPHILEQISFKFERDIIKGLSFAVTANHEDFSPLFPFAFLHNNGDPTAVIKESYKTTEVSFETRFARDELFIYDNNLRFSLGKSKSPIITFKFTKGIDNVLDSDFNYQKFTLRVQQNINFGLLGTGQYITEAGYIPNTLPFPLLKNHLGNNFIFFNTDVFNLMDKGEFVSDKYIFLKYSHFFQGYILNRIPLMRKLRWRLVGTFNMLYGELDQKQRDILPPSDLNGNPLPQIQSIQDEPYMEFGYGVENILRILRVQAFHRISYLDLPDAREFGIKLLFTIKP